MSHANGKLTVDLGAIAHNWSLMNSLARNAQCAAVIKANAYGLGVSEVARCLSAAGCTHYFVATVTEALEARARLPVSAAIFVLQGFTCESERQVCIGSSLIPVLITEAMVWRWFEGSGGRAAPCALKVNTGMNRLGVSVAELARLQADPRFTELNLVLLMSHLACADEAVSSFNSVQLDAFQNACRSTMALIPSVQASLANSAGALLGDAYHFDMVRPGIALYGGQPSVSAPVSGLRPVVTLRLPVIQVRSIRRGESVGYGRTFVATRDSVVATLASGYAEGLLRLASNRAAAWFHQPLPMVGRISMDSCAVDLTYLPEVQRPRVGDWIEILGAHITVDDLAWHAETIGYEVLTSLSGRLERNYVE